MPVAEKQPRMQYLAECRERWFAWRDSGKEPSQERALRIVQEELGKTNGLGTDYGLPEKDGRLADSFSFLIWDLTENGQGALDYDKQTGFIKSLLEQARMVIGLYARGSVKIGQQVISIGGTTSTPNRGRQRMVDATLEERQVLAAQMIKTAKGMILRWKGISGINWKFIRVVLLRLVREVRKEWKSA